MSSEECSFFNYVHKSRCVSPQLFQETYNPAHYTLRVVEPEVEFEDVQESLGFYPGQRFPWLSPNYRTQDGQRMTPDWYIPRDLLDLMSGRFPDEVEVLNDKQSDETTDYGWDRSAPKDNCGEHWKKRLISKFNDEM